jgi:ribosomal protein S18 acetylase RimI-like enzyme
VRIATVPKAAAPGKQAETVMAGLIVVRTVKLRSLGEQPAAGAATPAAAAAAGGAGAGAHPAAAAAAAGATAVATRGAAAPRAPLGFDLLETMNAETMGAEIVALVVLKKYRRNGVAQKLLNEALQDVLRGSPNVQVAFSFAPQNDVAATDFFERHNFDEFGVVRSFRGSAAPFSVWAQAFHNGTLATYAGEGDELPVLGPDAALKRRRHTPRWLIELGLQFGEWRAH